MTLTAIPISPSTDFALAPVTAQREVDEQSVGDIQLFHSPRMTPQTAAAALKTLQSFNAAGRRIVWCNPSELAVSSDADLAAWGRKIVEAGGAETVVVLGAGAREVALAARDAGLPLGRVVVCRDDATARNVLGDTICRGDALLALGIDSASCQRLMERLETKPLFQASV